MAVHLRKLAPDEAQRAFPGRGHQDLAEDVAALRALQPGDAAALGRQGRSERAIKRRLGAAAKQLGYRLRWARPSSPDALYFQVLGRPPAPVTTSRRRRAERPQPAPPAAPAPEPTAPRPERNRRRRTM